jgi:hypothetical protein
MHFRFENGAMTADSPSSVRRDILAIKDTENERIYHVSINDPELGQQAMSPKPMKIIEDLNGMKFTLEGLGLNDPDNRWGQKFDDYRIQFTASAMSSMTGQPVTASLLLKGRNILITYQ